MPATPTADTKTAALAADTRPPEPCTALQVPDRRIIQVVCDAAPLVAALESGIPTSYQLLEGLTKIPLADWKVRYRAYKGQAITTLTASQNAAQTNPFSVQLHRTVTFLGAGGALDFPETSYRGSITYSIGNTPRTVQLDSFPGALTSIFPDLENKLQEPSLCQQRIAISESKVRAYATRIQSIITNLSQANVKEVRSLLEPQLRHFLRQDANSVLLSWRVDEHSYVLHTVKQAFLFAFPTGDAIALARIQIRPSDDRHQLEPAVLLVASLENGKQRLVEILPKTVGLQPQALYDAVWKLTER